MFLLRWLAGSGALGFQRRLQLHRAVERKSTRGANPRESKIEPSPLPHIVLVFGFLGKPSIGALWQFSGCWNQVRPGEDGTRSRQSPYAESFLTRSRGGRITRPSDQPSRYHLGPCSRPDHGPGHATACQPQQSDKSPGRWYLPKLMYWLAFSLEDAARREVTGCSLDTGDI